MSQSFHSLALHRREAALSWAGVVLASAMILYVIVTA